MNLFDLANSFDEVKIKGQDAIIDILGVGFDSEKCKWKEHKLEPITGYQICKRCNSMISVVIFSQ